MAKAPPKLSIAERIAAGANLSINEIAALAGVGRVKVYEEIAAGRLNIIKIGRRTFARPVEAKRWLDSFGSAAPSGDR